MHYLKCSKCGYFNQVKTEYLVLCSHCNTRLTDNFTDWKKKNEDKSFEEYMQLVCTTDKEPPTTEKSHKNKRKGLRFWISFAIGLAIVTTLSRFGGEAISELFNKSTLNPEMMEIASEINKHCPVMVDNATRFDNAMVMSDNILQYNYTLVKWVKDSININELKSYIEPTIINLIKTNPDMKTLRDNKTTFRYYYKDRKGAYLFRIVVKPEQYE